MRQEQGKKSCMSGGGGGPEGDFIFSINSKARASAESYQEGAGGIS